MIPKLCDLRIKKVETSDSSNASFFFSVEYMEIREHIFDKNGPIEIAFAKGVVM